jgi:quinol monooxygenase YgiN
MHRRNILKSIFAGVAAGFGAGGAARVAKAAQSGTNHVRVYCEMDIAPAREKEMLDVFHKVFVPEAVRHEGFIRVKLLKRVNVMQGTVPQNHNYRFELEYENEELRQKWAKSPEHQRVWPQVERFITTQKTYPVTLYQEA